MNVEQQVRIDASLRAIAEEAMKLPDDQQVNHVKDAMQRLKSRMDVPEDQQPEMQALIEDFELRALGYLRALQEVEGFSVFLDDLQHGLEARPVAPVPPEDVRSARISVLITAAQREQLHELGYSEEDIHRMSPREAHDILGKVDFIAADVRRAEAP